MKKSNAILTKYKTIAKRSFRAKWRIYLFDRVSNLEINHINQEDFIQYQLRDESIKQYTNEYWQFEKDELVNKITVSKIEQQINAFEKAKPLKIVEFENDYTANQFSKICSITDFEVLCENQQCYYCKITIDEINTL